ncbi:MAG: AI-2E family transporter [Candidatus Sumerlaeia bacterium]
MTENSLPLAWRKTLAAFAIVALAVFILRQVGPILTTIMDVIGPFLLALILAYVFHPVVLFVQRRLRLGRVAGIFVLAGLVVAVLIGLMLWLIPVLYQQLSAGVHELLAWLTVMVDKWGAAWLDEPTRSAIKDSLSGDLGQIEDLLRRFSGGNAPGRTVATGSVTAMKSVAGGLAISIASIIGLAGSLSIVGIIAFYLLVDFDHIPPILKKLLPAGDRERIWKVMVQADRAVGGFLRGQLTVCAINGCLMALLLAVIGMRQYAVLIGFVAGLLNFIPYLGPLAGFIPGVLWILFSSQYPDWNARGAYLGVLLLGNMAIQANEGFILQPYIVGKHASLHPLMVMAALVIGAQGGIGGMIVAVPIAAVVKVAWVELFWKDKK